LAEATVATVGEALRRGVARLEEAGCETPRLDAELLLAEVLGAGRERLVLDRDRELTGPDEGRYDELLIRREAREPVAYILGRREFRRLTLAVDRRVLIPRPETELLVEVGLELPPQALVADVGTGSGAVALALADERPDLRVVGLDVDPQAVAVARANAVLLGLGDRVELACSDLLGGRRFDAVLANLPYVAAGAALAPEIAGFEPPSALYAGADGLDLVRRLVAEAAGVALLALEISPEQADTVEGLLLAAGFGSVERRRDLAGRERVVIGRA
jgi:release factor glutamine methyltransferase